MPAVKALADRRQEMQSGREEMNYVVGWSNEERYGSVGPVGYAVWNPEKTVRLQVDHSHPVTLARCAEILRAARELSGRDLFRIAIHHSIYSKTPGNAYGDFAETCYLDKRYEFDARSNALLIFDRDEPVYANWDGDVSRDHATICDCLYD